MSLFKSLYKRTRRQKERKKKKKITKSNSKSGCGQVIHAMFWYSSKKSARFPTRVSHHPRHKKEEGKEVRLYDTHCLETSTS